MIILIEDDLDSMRNWVESRIGSQVWDAAKYQMENQVVYQVMTQMENQIGDQVRDQIWGQMYDNFN